MRIERVCIAGAGAIGSLLAGHLARVCGTSVLVRRHEHAAAIAARGLRVSGKSDFTSHPLASTDPDDLPVPDLVIVATKALHVDATTASFADRWPDATVMTIQNGIGAEEVVARHGPWPIISSVTFMSGTRHGDVHVEYELDTPTWMGPWAGSSPAAPFATVQEVAELIVRAGLQAEALPDLLPAQWSKLVFNSAVNAVAAVTGLPHVGAFVETGRIDSLGHVVRGMMEEGAAVARAAGIVLHGDPWEMNMRAVARGETGSAAYAHPPSMLADVRERRLTEVDFITGAVVREAERLDVPVPLTAALYRLVRGVEAGYAYAGSAHREEGA